MRNKTVLLATAVIALFPAAPALANSGDPIVLAEDWSLDIQANARIRYESVDQASAANTADALTVRGRLGAELTHGHFKVLVEGEGTAALVDDYNDTIASNGVEPFPVVADPESIQLNRAQVAYVDTGFSATVGRQRINMGNQRFVGAVGWRQNEQTFDAVRITAGTGPFTADVAYSISQHTIFGSESPNSAFDGDFGLINLNGTLGPVQATAFSYILDYDTRVAYSSQTYGLTAKATLPLGGFNLNLSGSFATQADAGGNPTDYNAEYFMAEAGGSLAGFTLKAGYEELGSDGGVAAFQTPLATAHAFQGWADLFLSTPANGVRDYYASLGRQIAVPGVATFNAMVVYHEFEADFGGASYGSEWDASLGFRVGPVALLAKYANYDADTFGTNTEKFWLQAEYNF